MVPATEIDALGARGVAERILARVGGRPAYISIDIDVLDPAFAPGTGTPEAGGMTSRELLAILRELADLDIVGADIVEVAPAYDHAEITGIAASHTAYELLSAMAPSDPEARMTPLVFAQSLVAAFAASDATRYFAHFDPDATFLFHDSPGRIESRADYEAMWAQWEREDGFRVLGCTRPTSGCRSTPTWPCSPTTSAPCA